MKDKKAALKPPGFLRVVLYLVIFLTVIMGTAAYIVFKEDFQESTLPRVWAAIWTSFAGPEEAAQAFIFDAHLENRYAALGGGLAVLSPTRFVYYAPSGKEERVKEGVFTQPALAASSRVAVGYDRGGNTLVAMSDQAVLLDTQWPGIILAACAGQRGEFAVVAEESGYKAAVTVFDTNARACYKYYSATHYLSSAALSPDGRYLAVSGVGFANNWVSSQVLFFTLDDEQPLKSVDIPDTLVLAVYYLANDRVCVIGEEEILFFDHTGERLGAYRWENRVLLDYTPGPEEQVMLRVARNTAGSHSELLLLDAEGRLLRQSDVPADILSQSAAGKYAALLSGERLIWLDSGLQSLGELSTDGLARFVLQRPDGSVFLVESDRAHIAAPASA